MMKLSRVNDWGLIISSIDGTRPAAAMGASITPTQNTTGGSYATLLAGASVTEDVYAIEININSISINATARDAIATLAFDPAGGTSWTDWANLLCGQASWYGGSANISGLGANFYFPRWIKAGTSIGMRGSVSTADVTAFAAFVRLYCKPRYPELIWSGTKLVEYGLTIASSTGTAITAGTASEGSWTSIGTTTRDHRFYEYGFGANDSTLSANVYSVDIGVGDASNKRVIAMDHGVQTGTSEQVCKLPCPTWANTKSGDIVYARTQVGPGAADTHSIAVYAMGD